MLQINAQTAPGYCDGISRRSFVRVGLSGMGALSLSQILRAKQATADSTGSAGKDTSIILIWLDGGPGHMDTYDMKPQAPAEYRGLWLPIPTNVPGIEVSPLFPRQARRADLYSVIRSLHHDQGDHFTAGHYMLTGVGGASGAESTQKHPFVGSVASKLAGARRPGMPAYVAVPYAASIGLRPGYFGSHMLGMQYNPFETEGDPNGANFQVQNLQLNSGLTLRRLEDRQGLHRTLDRMRRDVDNAGLLPAMDRFEQAAFELVTGTAARRAFDIGSEDPRIRDKYGRTSWGQSTLLARRLVEAGSTLVTVHFGGWDNHWDLKQAMENYLPQVDMAVSALLDDLYQTGLIEKTLVLLCGEFSRTPRMNDGGNGGPPLSMGTPGRDHWGNAISCLVAGAGVKGGRLIGSTNRLGEVPKDRPLTPSDLHHTMFHILGIDRSFHFINPAGRPVAALQPGEVIHDLF